MKRKITFAVSGCAAVVLALAALSRASAAPGDTAPAPSPVSGRVASRPPVFTLRYVAFVARPKTKEVAARYKTFPPVLAHNLSEDNRYAMTTTPESFAKLLRADQPDHDFTFAMVGSTVLYNSRDVQNHVTAGPDSSDPYAFTVADNITISQNSDTTLDLASKGTFSYRLAGAGSSGDKSGWDGENKEFKIGRTYQWGGNRYSDGTCVTWAFCILPGNLDQAASAWKRYGGARATTANP